MVLQIYRKLVRMLEASVAKIEFAKVARHLGIKTTMLLLLPIALSMELSSVVRTSQITVARASIS